ncbi:MAG: Maf family nucleotide pyrophosphatase [Lachnospiraceae bacterium]
MKVILASGSPRRKQIMADYGISFEIMVSDCDETMDITFPDTMVEELSRRKAGAVLRCRQELGLEQEPSLIIGADTVVAFEDAILGKPKDDADAFTMLSRIQGNRHQVYTGVTILYGTKEVTFSERTDVFVKAMSSDEIREYIATGEGRDKAGSYAMQGIFSKYIEAFDGDYYNVVGLPMDTLLNEMRKLGYHLPETSVKLVVSDIDGTLVKDSSPEIYPEMIQTIKDLLAAGYQFCIASGRQYASIHSMFREVADDIIFLCENGAHLVYHGKNLHIKEMNRKDVEGILHQLREISPAHPYVISTPDGCFLENPSEEFETLIRDCYHNKYEICDDFLALKLPCIKLAIYEKGSIRQLGENVLIPQWKGRVKTCMAGEEWVDFMDKSVDKGNALEYLLDYLGIRREETMVFADNANDIGLFKAAEESYVVSNARPEIKAMGKYICQPYWHKGVYKVIRDRLGLDEKI